MPVEITDPERKRRLEEKFRQTLELHDLGVAMMRQKPAAAAPG